MADKPDQNEENTAEATVNATGFRPRAKALLRRFWYVPAVLGIMALQMVSIAVYRCAMPAAPLRNSYEVSLGEFGFEAITETRSMISSADFSLHISLIPEIDRPARFLLNQHQYLLQQNIEELLRQAAPGDFEDPSLAELKRQLQATVNQTVGRRIVAEVIITDLKLDRGTATETPSAETEAITQPTAPWREAEAAS